MSRPPSAINITVPPLPQYIRWVGVGWQRNCKTFYPLRELHNNGAILVFWRSAAASDRVEDHLRGVETLYSAQGE